VRFVDLPPDLEAKNGRFRHFSTKPAKKRFIDVSWPGGIVVSKTLPPEITCFGRQNFRLGGRSTIEAFRRKKKWRRHSSS